MKKVFLFIAVILFATTVNGQYNNYLHIDSEVGSDSTGYLQESFYVESGVSFFLQANAIVGPYNAAIAGYNFDDGAHEIISSGSEGYKDITYTESGGYTFNIYTQLCGDGGHAQVTATW